MSVHQCTALFRATLLVLTLVWADGHRTKVNLDLSVESLIQKVAHTRNDANASHAQDPQSDEHYDFSPESIKERFLKELPDDSNTLQESYYYLSTEQRADIEDGRKFRGDHHVLAQYSDLLPGWVPWRDVARAMGHALDAIEAAERVKGGSVVWASEFENVHSFWHFTELGFKLPNGDEFGGSEQLYQLLKAGEVGSDGYEEMKRYFVRPCTPDEAYALGRPRNIGRFYHAEEWVGVQAGEGRRDEAMKFALGMKFSQDKGLRNLLLATKNHMLASIKGDTYFGIGFDGLGKNKLPEYLEALRAELGNGSEIDSPVPQDDFGNGAEIAPPVPQDDLTRRRRRYFF